MTDRTKAALAIVGIVGLACMVGGAYLLHPGLGLLVFGFVLVSALNASREVESKREVVMAMEATDAALDNLEASARRASHSFGSGYVVKNPPPKC